MRTMLILGLCVWLLGCGGEEPGEPPASTPPKLEGEGVAIYRAKLEWEPFNRTVRLKSATILGQEPIVKPQDILYYYRYRPNPQTRHHWMFELSKRVEYLSGTMISPMFGTPVPLYSMAADTGLCVTVNREIIYAGIFGHMKTNHNSDLIFRTANLIGKENSLMVVWDSTYVVNAQVLQQTGPDPRYDKRLLDRLRQEGKLRN